MGITDSYPRTLIFATILCMTFSCLSASAGTVAHWRFEEGVPGSPASSSILDSSGNGLHGTAYGGVAYSSNTPNAFLPQSGAPNGAAMAFDGGTNTRIVIDDDPLFALTESFTLEAYINLAALPATGYQWQILFRGDSRGGLDPYYLDVWDGDVRFTINEEPSGGARVAASAPTLNTWTHIAGVLDGDTGEMSLYFDGILVDSTVTSARPFAFLDPSLQPGISIGGYPDSHYGPFHGLIDEVRISDVALSPDEFLIAPPVVPVPAASGLAGIGFALVAILRRRKT